MEVREGLEERCAAPRSLEDCDAIVIGAGLGGLTCAVELARQGLKVCVLEGGPLPGGCLRAIRTEGYHFNLSPEYLGGLQPGGASHGILHGLGVLEDVRLRKPEIFLTAELQDFRVQLPNDGPALLQALCSRFPRERQGLEALFDSVPRIKAAVLASTLGTQREAEAGRQVLSSWRDRSFEDLLADFVVDPRLRALLGQTWPSIGLPPSQAAAPFNACVFSSGWIEGIRTVVGGGAALVHALVERLRNLGGDCLMNRPVRRILLRDGRVSGLQFESGQRVECPLVIAAVDPYQVFFRLVPGDEISRLFRFRLERLEPSISMTTLHLGLDCPPSRLGIPAGTSYFAHQPDHDESYRRVMERELHHTDWRLTSFEGSHDECYPTGGGIVSLSEPAVGRSWLGLDASENAARKAQARAALLGKAERRFPGLSDHIVLSELATPYTLHRILGTHQGAVFGFAQTVAQSGRRRLGTRAPLAGLFLAGAWARAGGGCEGALLGGLQAAVAAMAYAEHNPVAPALGLAADSEAASMGSPGSPVAGALTWPARGREQERHYRHRHPVGVYGEDLNSRGYADVEAYLRYLDRGRMEAIEALCQEQGRPSWHDSHLVSVYRIQARCALVVGLGSKLEVRTGLRRVSTHRGAFDQRLVDRQTGALLMEGSVEVLFLDRQGAMLPAPDELSQPESLDSDLLAEPIRTLPFSDREHFPFRSKARVYFEDTDLQGITFHVSYLRFAERALFDLVRTVWPGLGTQTWMSRYRVGICGGDLRYLRPTRLGDRLEVWTAVLTVEQAEMSFAQRIVLQGSEEVVADFVTLVEFRDEHEQVIPLPRPLVDVAIANLFKRS